MDDLSHSATCRLTEVAIRLSERGRFAEAEAHLLRAAECLRRSGTNPERAAVWNQLGMVCKYLGKFHSAERYYRQALRCAGQLEGQKRNQLIADLFHNLGGVEHSRGRFATGERYARKGLRLRLQFCAAGSPAVASDLAGLAAILYGLGKIDEAGKLYHRALSIYRRHFGANHAEIAVVLNNLGSLFQASRRPERAEEY
jgi:tetratricopeptide (TPR) repeat protein